MRKECPELYDEVDQYIFKPKRDAKMEIAETNAMGNLNMILKQTAN
jgi:hypothetical protein